MIVVGAIGIILGILIGVIICAGVFLFLFHDWKVF